MQSDTTARDCSSAKALTTSFHSSAKRVSKHLIKYPNRGIPLMGKTSITAPTIIARRSKYLEAGMLICLHMDDGKRTPFFIAKVLYLFEDRLQRGNWMRVKWFVNSDGKSVFNDKYRDLRPRKDNDMEENVHLFDCPSLGNVILIHWHVIPLPDKLKHQAMLTRQNKLTRAILKLCKHDINLVKLGVTGAIP